jgi:hypothetical protein
MSESPNSSNKRDFFCFEPTVSVALLLVFRPRLPRFFFSDAGTFTLVGIVSRSVAAVTKMGGTAPVLASIGNGLLG